LLAEQPKKKRRAQRSAEIGGIMYRGPGKPASCTPLIQRLKAEKSLFSKGEEIDEKAVLWGVNCLEKKGAEEDPSEKISGLRESRHQNNKCPKTPEKERLWVGRGMILRKTSQDKKQINVLSGASVLEELQEACK